VIKLDIADIEKRLLDIDAEVHRILSGLGKMKKVDTKAELSKYEHIKDSVSKKLKKPIEPTLEVRKMRDKKYAG
jgi:hypothetical protein